MSVIVTNAKNRIAYAVIRCLSQHGIETFTADSIPTAMSYVSRYSSGHFRYPSPYDDEMAFIDCLIEKCKKLKADVLIPVYEETFVIAKYKKLLSGHVNLFVPDYDRILAVHDKLNLFSLAKTLTIPSPHTIAVADLENCPMLAESFRFPILIKPRQGGGAWGIERVNSVQGLIEIINSKKYPGNFSGDRFIAQELISGSVICCAMLMKQGEYRAGCCYRQLRETPLSGGTATYRESIIAPDIIGHLRQLLGYLKWDGVCQADFIVDDSTGGAYLIDVNPRFWGSLFQTIISGVEFPHLVYKLAKGQDFSPVTDYKTHLRSRWIGGDIRCFIDRIQNPLVRPDLALKDFYCNFATDKYDDFELRDPLPFFMWFVDYFYKMFEQKSFHPVPHEGKDGVWE